MTRPGGWPKTGFGERLKAERERAGLTQKDLAEKVGCHPITVSEMERETQQPVWPMVLALAQVLGISPLDFLLDRKPPWIELPFTTAKKTSPEKPTRKRRKKS